MKDNWDNFSILGDQGQLFNFLELIERIRNIIAHHNFVNKDNQDAMNVYLKSWMKAVEANKVAFQVMQ